MKSEAKPYKTKPSVWPKWYFLGLRALQVVLACIPLGIVSWFIYALKDAGYAIPWQFGMMATAGALTIVSAVATAYLMFAQTLTPIIVMGVDSVLIGFWIISWASLAAAMKSNLGSTCSKKNWGDSTGVRVCNSFKGAFTFSLLSCIALGGSIFIATRVRTAKSRAKYAAMRASTGSTILLKPTGVPANDTSYPDGTQRTFMSTSTSNPFAGGTYRNSTLTVGSNPFVGGTMNSTMTGMTGHTRTASTTNPEFTYSAPQADNIDTVQETDAAVKAQEAGTSYAGFNDPLGQEIATPTTPMVATLVDIEEKKIG